LGFYAEGLQRKKTAKMSRLKEVNGVWREGLPRKKKSKGRRASTVFENGEIVDSRLN